MTLTPLIIPILLAAATPMADSPATATPMATSPAVVAPVPAATPQPAQLEFPQAGFRINALDSPTKKLCIFTMSLPVSGNSNSPPSVSVVRGLPMKERPSYQNLKDAKTLLAHNGDTVLLERTISPAEWQTEYISTKAEHLNFETGVKIHVYRRMVTANGMIYDVSATAPEARWPELGAKLKACVDSFEPSTDPAPGKVVFSQQGYRIAKLDGAAPADAKQTLINMPGGVLVGIQPYTESIEEYKAHHEPDTFRNQVKIRKENGVMIMTTAPGPMKILTENAPAQNALVTEYAEEILLSPLQQPPDGIVEAPSSIPRQVGHALIYEKVILVHGQLYWAAGIHDEENNAVSYAQIKACVDSLEAIPTPAPAAVPPPPAPAPTK